MKNTRMKNKQQGMTLVEIMIALLLGAFLLAGVMQIFLSTKRTYQMQENMSRLQENGRFAMEFLNRDIRMAGFRCWPNAAIATPVAGTDNDADNGNDILDGTDSITVGMGNLPCPAAGETAIRYRIDDGTSGQPSLFQNIQELIEGVEDMQILYGADTNADNTPDYYVAAGTAGLTMNQVVSIRIFLTVRTLDNNLTTTGDGRLRRTFSSTIAVRNLLP